MNIVSAALGDAMNVSSGSFPYGKNEFTEADLDMANCETVSVPRVKAAPAALECRLWQAIELPTQKDGAASTIALGTVTGIHIADEVVVNGKIDVTIYKPLADLDIWTMHKLLTLFEMKRPIV